MTVRTKFEVRSFTRMLDNRGYLKLWAVPGYAQAPFSPKLLLGIRMDPVNVPAKFEVCGFTRSWDNRRYLKTLGSPCIRRWRSSKVIDFGTIRKRVCGFLLVRHSNLAPILHRLGDIAGFYADEWPQSYSTLIWGWCRCTRSPLLGSARA